MEMEDVGEFIHPFPRPSGRGVLGPSRLLHTVAKGQRGQRQGVLACERAAPGDLQSGPRGRDSHCPCYSQTFASPRRNKPSAQVEWLLRK